MFLTRKILVSTSIHRAYDELLTNTEFDSFNNTAKLRSMKENVKNTILEQAEKDLGSVLPTLTEDVYGFGKQVARLANLAKILWNFQELSSQDQNYDGGKNNNGENDTSTFATEHSDFNVSKMKELSMKANSLLHRYLTAFLDGVNSDNLVYDANFGGIITRNGLLNKQADFGNGWYNDHHFHYGYILYASAIMGKINSTFVQEYGIHVEV